MAPIRTTRPSNRDNRATPYLRMPPRRPIKIKVEIKTEIETEIETETKIKKEEPPEEKIKVDPDLLSIFTTGSRELPAGDWGDIERNTPMNRYTFSDRQPLPPPKWEDVKSRLAVTDPYLPVMEEAEEEFAEFRAFAQRIKTDMEEKKKALANASQQDAKVKSEK